MGHVHFVPVGGSGEAGRGAFTPPQHECSSGFAVGEVYFAGSASNFARQDRLQKW
jgi:hypothetical protein